MRNTLGINPNFHGCSESGEYKVFTVFYKGLGNNVHDRPSLRPRLSRVAKASLAWIKFPPYNPKLRLVWCPHSRIDRAVIEANSDLRSDPVKSRFWNMAFLAGCGLACANQPPKPEQAESKHGASEKAEAKFAWGPAAPEPPIMPSPVPQLPEQTNSPINPGDVNGPKMEDKLVPSTANPATPK